jgi:transglutaminase-like putative cysteine protease
MFETWLEPLPEGAAGTLQTLRRMKDLVSQHANDTITQQYAAHFAAGAAHPIDYINRAFLFARDEIKYKNDPAPYEMISGFPALAANREGDCDDKVIALCTLLKARGIACNFIAQSYDRDKVEAEGFDHVYAEAWDGRQWVGLDPTADGHNGVTQAMGWRQVLSARGFEYRVSV